MCIQKVSQESTLCTTYDYVLDLFKQRAFKKQDNVAFKQQKKNITKIGIFFHYSLGKSHRKKLQEKVI